MTKRKPLHRKEKDANAKRRSYSSVDPNAETPDGGTMLSVVCGEPKISLRKIPNLITPVNIVKIDVEGWTPLMRFLNTKRKEENAGAENKPAITVLDVAKKMFEAEAETVVKSKLASHLNLQGENVLQIEIRNECNIEVIDLIISQGAVVGLQEIITCLEHGRLELLFDLITRFKENVKIQRLRLTSDYPHLLLLLWYNPKRTLSQLKMLIEEFNFDPSYSNNEEGSVLHKCVQLPHVTENLQWVEYLLSLPTVDVNVVIQRPNHRVNKYLRRQDAVSFEPFSTPLAYALSEGENEIAVQLIKAFADVNKRKVHTMLINEDLSDALRHLFSAGYSTEFHGDLNFAVNCEFTDEATYSGLEEQQFRKWIAFEKRKVCPLKKIAANVVRANYQPGDIMKHIEAVTLNDEVIKALLLTDLSNDKVIDRNGRLIDKPDPIPDATSSEPLYVYRKIPIRRKAADLRKKL